MEITFTYQKKRSDFGRQCLFSDKGPDLIDHYPSNKKIYKEFILKDPVSRETQLAPTYAEHYLNTVSTVFKNSGCNHQEGGWPKDVNCLDDEQTKRYRRKIEKEDSFHHTLMQLFKSMESSVLQNNAINIYQEYFENLPQTPLVEQNSARTVNVYQDQTTPVRPVNHICWSPDQTKFVATHCNLVFQAVIPKKSSLSYIWEVENPNRPLYALKPPQQSACIEYNFKDSNLLASGQMNGQVALWDLRKGLKPVELSLRENSFLDPVQNVLWIHSKTNTEFLSSSTDGMLKWWDTRNMTQPTDTLILDYAREKDQRLSNALGASVIEYEITIPNRFMVGTEEGVLVMGNRKGKTAMEKMPLRIQAHYGPILVVNRNPAFLKNFLTVGDWSAKIWSEDCRESPIMWTPMQKAALTDGAWSTTRVSTFFTTRVDGTLDIWDFLQHQKHSALAVRVCDDKLTCLKPHDGGRFIAVGNQIGTTYLVELSKNLSASSKSEKSLFTAMLDREVRREKVLEGRARETRLKQKADKAAQAGEGEEGAPTTASIAAAEAAAAEAELTFIDKYVTAAGRDFTKALKEAKKGTKGKKSTAIEIKEIKSVEKRKSTLTDDEDEETSGGEGDEGDEGGQEGDEEEEEEPEEDNEEDKEADASLVP